MFDPREAFGTAFVYYFMSESVGNHMYQGVADDQDSTYELAKLFCDQNHELLSKTYSKVWDVIDEAAKQAKC